MVSIVQKDNPLLRTTSDSVKSNEFSSKSLTKIIEDMKKALSTQEDGVAIAAPQIGVSKKIFVVSGRVLSIIKDEKNHPDMVFINPEIIWSSKDKKLMEEGCLSVRYLYGKIRRSSRVILRYQNEDGQYMEAKASGLLSQIFQHETDHLIGKLFIDNATSVREMSKEEWNNTFKSK